MAPAGRRPAAFLDRDGVLNVDHGYVGRLHDVEWVPGAAAAVRRLNQAGYLVVVVTNQSGVARGYYSEQDVEELHRWMTGWLAEREAVVDGFYYCPYHELAVDERYRVADHPDRKPNPGMILRAATDLHIDLARSLLIGDKPSDLEAARRAGVAGYLFAGGALDGAVDRVLAAVQAGDAPGDAAA